MTTRPASRHEEPLKEGCAIERWIGLRRPARARRARLIVFSYAGSGASAYRRWITDLGYSDWLDLVAIQLPGRQKRLPEPPFTELTPLIDNLELVLLALLELPYVLLGYSMGATVAYELTVRVTTQRAAPALLIVAARPPWCTDGATAPALLERDLFDRYDLPTLRADFTLVDSFRRDVPQILLCPILALAGTDDSEVSSDNMQRWASAAGRDFTIEHFSGGHFFLHHSHDAIISVVTSAIQDKCIRRSS